MLASSLLSLVALAATAIARPSPASPALPSTKYLFSANLIFGTPTQVGATPAGQRLFATVSAGNFSGPGLQGTVVGGLDYGLTDSSGTFNPDAAFLMRTSDGCDIFVRERGHSPNFFLLFETACAKYAWLNPVVAYGRGTRITGGVSSKVFMIGDYEE